MQQILRSRTAWRAISRNSALRGQSFFHSSSRIHFRFTRTVTQEGRNDTPSFREKAGPEIHQDAFTEKLGKPGSRTQVVFVVLGTLCVFSFAAERTNSETEYWHKKLTAVSTSWMSTITTIDIKRAEQAEFVKNLRDWFTTINHSLLELPPLFRAWVAGGLVAVLQPWVDASEGKRLCWKICMLNAAVWAAWKIPRLQPAMARGFMHNPLSGLSFTLLTSMFSHRGLLHLIMNCLALEGFGSAAYFFLVKEQGKQQPPMLESTASYHFLSFFVSAGLFSGLVSHVVATKFRYPRLVAQLATETQKAKKVDTWAAALSASSGAAATATAKKTIPDILPSLGASGAIYSTVVVTALAFPDSQIALFIPPSYPINIQWGVGGLVLMDTIGILRGWRVFDHWAHLGGAFFGLAYYTCGPKIWQAFRQGTSLNSS